jgi:AcrR family transcriptional regulator
MNRSFIGKGGSVVPRTEEANQRIREEQRAKILEAAKHVFARKGRAATMADVAAEASISQGLAYRYFASKEALFQALIEQVMQSTHTLMQHIVEMPGTPGERLEFLLSRIVKGRHKHLEFVQFLSQVQSSEETPAHLREFVVKQGQPLRDMVRQLIVEGQATGEFAGDDPGQLEALIFACLDGVSRLALRDPEQFQKYLPDARIILRLLKP